MLLGSKASRIANFFDGLCGLIYPDNCLLCKGRLKKSLPTEILCPSCQDTIELNRPPFCKTCSRHLFEESDVMCGLCKDCQKTLHHFDCAYAATLYNDTMQRLIHLFKYGNKTSLRGLFYSLMRSYIDSYHIDMNAFDIVVPAPLHPTRLRERGYNQAQLLAEYVAKEFRLLISDKNLMRTRNTKNQARLKKKERWTNIEGAFRIKDPYVFDKKSVLVVDDLLTTGMTASEIARPLKEAGATKVGVLTLAIAI